jgi:hypothetical protein
MSLLSDNVEVSDVNISEGMEFSPQWDGTFGIPFTPVLDCECDVMLQRMTEFSGHSLSELAGEFRRNPAILEAIQRRDHLIMSRTSPPKVTVRGRCLCCGRVKSGSHHPGGVPAISQAACTATQFHEGWVIPPGYGVDDERPKQTLREVKALWKARRKELGVEDENVFQDWNLACLHL